ncbi:MAG: hypothetical protein KGI33_08770 [Thaumarchaeota archaeon]|nr:hypothetical protein [Nitrososphaerota archaeon]
MSVPDDTSYVTYTFNVPVVPTFFSLRRLKPQNHKTRYEGSRDINVISFVLFFILISNFVNVADASLEEHYNQVLHQPTYDCHNGSCMPTGSVQGEHLATQTGLSPPLSQPNPLIPMTVTTDKSSYYDGDTITISGTTRDYLGDMPITINIRNPIGNVVSLAQISVLPNHTFSTTVTATGPLWQDAGMYTVYAQYGATDRSAETTFQLSAGISHASQTVQVTISYGASNTRGICTFTSCFDPNIVNIKVGDAVTWTNADIVGHTATSGRPSDNQTGTVWDSSLIPAGKSYTSPPFTTPGTYNYFCQVHPWMTGVVIVSGAPLTSGILDPTITTVLASQTTLNTGAPIIVTANIVGTASNTIPTGAVSWGDGSAGGTFTSQSCQGTENYHTCTATYTAPNTPSNIVITANYLGDSNNAPSSGSTNISVITSQFNGGGSPSPTILFIAIGVVAFGIALFAISHNVGKSRNTVTVRPIDSGERGNSGGGGPARTEEVYHGTTPPTYITGDREPKPTSVLKPIPQTQPAKPRSTASGPTHGTLPAGFKPVDSSLVEKTRIHDDPLLGVQADWFSLAEQSPDDSVIVNGIKIPKLDCYRRAAESNQNEPKIWKSLGLYLRKDQTVEINNKKFSKRDCLLHAMNLGLKDAYIWASLGESLDNGESVFVEGKSMTAIDCYLEEALLLYPQ